MILCIICIPLGIYFLFNQHKKQIEARQRAAEQSYDDCPYFVDCEGGKLNGVYYSS